MRLDPYVLMRSRSGERGSAMIATILITAIVTTIGILSVRTAMHTDDVTSLDRMRSQALHAAEAGVNAAIHRLQLLADCPGISEPVALSAPDAIARYQVRVDPAEDTSCFDTPERVIRSWGYAPEGSGRSMRHLEVGVRLIPQDGFQFSLFAAGADGIVTTHNTPIIQGDVYAENLDQSHNNLDADSVITPGSIDTKNNSSYSGSLWAGGNVLVRQGGRIGGSITAAGSSAPGNVLLENGVVVSRDVKAAGNIGVGGTAVVHGSISEGNSSLLAPPVLSKPTFLWDASNYDPPPVTYNSASAAQTHLMANNANLKGTINVTDATGTIDLGFVGSKAGTVTGPLTIVTAGKVSLGGSLSATGSHQVVIVSTCTATTCISIDKPLTVAPSIDMLLFTHGGVEIKNSTNFTGAVYANRIDVKNSAVVRFSASLAHNPPPGFLFNLSSASRFMVVPVIWRELSPTPPLS